MSPKQSIFEMTPDALQLWLKEQGLPAFRLSQMKDWIFTKRVVNPDDMSNLSQDLKKSLTDSFLFTELEILEKLDSQDGATKILFKTLSGDRIIESVILRYEDRVSLCISSQVGCKMACSFCQTGKLGFFKNLSVHEIMMQIYQAQKILNSENKRLSHVVFMGMGEPMDNYETTMKATKLMVDQNWGLGLSWKHVTVSTSGLAPKIKTFAVDGMGSLAISLHAANDDLRTELMPINRKYSLKVLKEALHDYQNVTQKIITFEYLLIRGKNSSQDHAKQLVSYLHGLQAKVNLIAFNEHPGLPYERPTMDEMKTFQKYLSDRSIPAPIRFSKGLDVSGACGQLAAKRWNNLDAIPERSRAMIKHESTFQNLSPPSQEAY